MLTLFRSRLYGLTYSTLIAGLVQAKVSLDRKILSELAMFEPYSFRAVTLAAQATGVKSARLGDSRTMVLKKTVQEAQ